MESWLSRLSRLSQPQLWWSAAPKEGEGEGDEGRGVSVGHEEGGGAVDRLFSSKVRLLEQALAPLGAVEEREPDGGSTRARERERVSERVSESE